MSPLPTPVVSIQRDTVLTPLASAVAEDAMDSEVLLKGRREVLIRHGDRVYRLRHTSNDKLILTK